MPTLSAMKIPPPTAWDEFEEIALSALKIRWKNPNLCRNGRQGQPQCGVDIYGDDHRGLFVGVQCKLKAEGPLTIAKVKEEVTKAEAFVPRLDAFFVGTTRSSDVKLQEAVRRLSSERKTTGEFPVTVLFWNDLLQDLTKDVEELRKHYPQIFVGEGPGSSAERAALESGSPTPVDSDANKAKPVRPRVYVSYTHDSDDHKAWVRELVARLRTDGVDITFDYDFMRAGSDFWPLIEAELERAAVVLLVCTPEYQAKAMGLLPGGLRREYEIINRLAALRPGLRVIPILRLGAWGAAVPIDFSSRFGFDFRDVYPHACYRQVLNELLSSSSVDGNAVESRIDLEDSSINDVLDGYDVVDYSRPRQLTKREAPGSGRSADPRLESVTPLTTSVPVETDQSRGKQMAYLLADKAARRSLLAGGFSSVFYPAFRRALLPSIKSSSVYFDKTIVLSPITIVNDMTNADHYSNLRERLIKEFGRSLGFRPLELPTKDNAIIIDLKQFYRAAAQALDEGFVRIVNPFDELASQGYANEFEEMLLTLAAQKLKIREAAISESIHTAWAAHAYPAEMGLAWPIRHMLFANSYLHCESAAYLRRETASQSDYLIQVEQDTLESVMIKSAALLAENYGAIPLSDNYKCDNYLMNLSPHRRARQGYVLSHHAIARHIPSFSSLSFGRISELRGRFDDELSSFRTTMQSLSAKIENEQWASADAEREAIELLVATEVESDLRNLRLALKESRLRWVSRAISGALPIPALCTLIATIAPDAPLVEGLLASAGVAALGYGVNAFRESQRLRSRNGLSFLLRLD